MTFWFLVCYLSHLKPQGKRTGSSCTWSSTDDRNRSRGTRHILGVCFRTVIKVYLTCATCIFANNGKHNSAKKYVFIGINEMRMIFTLFWGIFFFVLKSIFSTITRINFLLLSMLCFGLVPLCKQLSSANQNGTKPGKKYGMAETSCLTEFRSWMLHVKKKPGMMVGINSKNCEVKF